MLQKFKKWAWFYGLRTIKLFDVRSKQHNFIHHEPGTRVERRNGRNASWLCICCLLKREFVWRELPLSADSAQTATGWSTAVTVPSFQVNQPKIWALTCFEKWRHCWIMKDVLTMTAYLIFFFQSTKKKGSEYYVHSRSLSHGTHYETIDWLFTYNTRLHRNTVHRNMYPLVKVYK